MFPVNIAEFLRTAFFIEHLRSMLQSYHSTVKSAGMFVLWFHAPTCLQFWVKTYRKRCPKNSLLSVTKQILPCLNWFITCFRFQNMFWKNISCFWYWWKTYTKRFTSNNLLSRVRRLSLPALYSWSNSGYDLENGRMSCKQKFWIKNIVVKIPILILFRFCLLC